jgi:cytochrome o ubiquinol oxidase operon protein cyoD
MGNIISGISAFITLGSLAFVQVIIQLIFFLHLGEEESPRWNLISFLFMVGVVFIIVAGSLWIMFNLDYRMGHDMRHTRHTGHIGLENL